MELGFLPGGGIEPWLEPATGYVESEHILPTLAYPLITMAVVAIGVVWSWLVFGRDPIPVTPPAGSVLTRAARADLYGDRFNEAVFMRPGQYLTRTLVWFDSKGIDGAVNGTRPASAGSRRAAGPSRPGSSGRTRCPCWQARWSSSLPLLLMGGRL
jgi:NADH-quinone oxidoreductase subunit L